MNNTTFVCPHCKCEYDILELIETGDMEGTFSMNCVNCDKEFEVNFTTEIRFNIKPIN